MNPFVDGAFEAKFLTGDTYSSQHASAGFFSRMMPSLSFYSRLFLGPVRLTRELVSACPQLESTAWVLSTSAKSPITGLTISNGLRPGLAMLVKDLADELGPRGVRVNGLLPGRFDTPRVRELESGASDPEALRAQLTATIPLRRYGDPAEFGAVAAFVLSPVASYLTGSLVAIDGGSLRAL